MAHPPYLERRVDTDALRTLGAGRNLYVFGPPQTGKTALRLHIADVLRHSGLRVAEISLADAGQGAFTGATFYFALADAICRPFGLPDPRPFWEQHADLEPAERWARYLASAPVGAPAVLLIDDLEAILDRPDAIEPFFSALASEVPAAMPVVSCLFGTLQPIELGLDIRRPGHPPSGVRRWFRTAVELRPAPLTRGELGALRDRFEVPGAQTEVLLDAIHAWTEGQLALTAALVDAIDEGGPLLMSGGERETVAATVEALFVNPGPKGHRALASAAAIVDGDGGAETARLWRRMVQGETPRWRSADLSHRRLLLAGLARVDEGRLHPAHAVALSVFDDDWCAARVVAEGLPAKVEAWLASDQDPALLISGADLSQATAWSEGREVDPSIAEFLLASWVHARHSESPPPVAPPEPTPTLQPIGVAPPVAFDVDDSDIMSSAPPLRMDAPSTTPAAAAPPLIEAVAPTPVSSAAPTAVAAPVPSAGSVPVAGVAAVSPPQRGGSRMVPIVVGVLAVAVVGLVGALWQTQQVLDRALTALEGRSAPVAAMPAAAEAPREGTATQAASALGTASAAVQSDIDDGSNEAPSTAAVAIDGSVWDRLARPTSHPAPAAARVAPQPGAVAAPVDADAEATARLNAEARSLAERRSAGRTAPAQAAPTKVAEMAVAVASGPATAHREARRSSASEQAREAKKARRAKEAHRAKKAHRAKATRRAQKAQRTEKARSARTRRPVVDGHGSVLVSAKPNRPQRVLGRSKVDSDIGRTGPIPADPPEVAIGRQAPTYRRSLVRCKRYDLPQTVRMTLVVRPDGQVASARLVSGSADRLDTGCLIQSAERFRFAPFNGRAVTTSVVYRL